MGWIRGAPHMFDRYYAGRATQRSHGRQLVETRPNGLEIEYVRAARCPCAPRMPVDVFILRFGKPR